MYPHFYMGGKEYSTYWAVFLLGAILMFLVNIIRGRKRNIGCLSAIFITVIAIFASLIGAKILYYLENISILLEGGIRLNGVSFFGSVFLLPAFLYGISKIWKKPLGWMLDYCSPSLMLMLGTLRIGCFLSGCCGGIAVTLGGFYIDKFPTQIVECICDLMIMVGLLLYEKYAKKEGRLYPFIMLYYGILRFLLEFVRDTPKDWLGLSHGQWFSIVSVIIGTYFFNKMEKEERKKQAGTTNRRKKRRKK